MSFDDHLQKLEQIKKNCFLDATYKLKLDTADNYIPLLASAMSAVKESDIHGFQKKEIVTDVMAKIVDQMTVSDETKTMLREHVAPALGDIMDRIVAATKGYLFLKKSKDNDDDDDDHAAPAGCFCLAKPKVVAAKREVKELEPTTTEEIVDALFEKVKAQTEGKPLDFCTVVHVGVTIMQALDQFFALSGEDKKCILVTTLHKIVNEAELSDSTRAILNKAIDLVIPPTVNIIVAAARGQFTLQLAVDEVKASCCASK